MEEKQNPSLTPQQAVQPPAMLDGDFILTAVRYMGEGLCVTDLNGEIQFLNEAAEKMLWPAAAGQQPANLFDLLQVDRAWLGELAQQVIEHQLPLRGDNLRLANIGSSPVELAYTVSARPADNGRPQLIFLLRDISRRKQLERRLMTRERQLETAQRLTKLGSWDWDIKNNSVFWTRELFRIYGYEPGAVTPSYELAMKHIHPDDRPQVEAQIKQAVEEQDAFQYTCRLLPKGGAERIMTVHGSMRFDEAGELVHMWGTAQDITELIQLGEIKKRTRLFAERLINSGIQGIVAFDRELRYLLWNPMMEQLTGFAADKVVGRTVQECFPALVEDGEIDHFYRALAGEEIWQPEYTYNNEQTGDPIFVELFYGPLLEENGETIGGLVLVRDITAQRKAQRELVEVKRKLARSRENERVYLAQELHDGPMQDLYATTYQLQALKRLVGEGRSSTLVDNVLDQFQKVNDTLRAICRDLRPPSLAAFGLESAIRSHAERFQKLYPDLTITLDMDRDDQALPEYVRLTLFRIAQEMLSNVAKHAEATQVLIRFELNASELLLEIQDNGNGFEVPERWIELVRDGHLGLMGASERAEEIDGTLTILSTPGQGTIVRVSAPHPLAIETADKLGKE